MKTEKYNISKERLVYMRYHLKGSECACTTPLSKIRNYEFNRWSDVEGLILLIERLAEFKLEYIKPKDSGFTSAVAAICKAHDYTFLEARIRENSMPHLLFVLGSCLKLPLFSDLPDTVKRVISALDLLGNDLENLLKENKND